MRWIRNLILTVLVLGMIFLLLMLYLNEKDGFRTPIEEIWEDIKNVGTITQKSVNDVLDDIDADQIRQWIAPSPSPSAPDA